MIPLNTPHTFSKISKISLYLTWRPFSKSFKIFCHSILPYCIIESQTTWWTFSTCHDMVLHTRSLRCLQISQGVLLLRKNQNPMKFLQRLVKSLVKKFLKYGEGFVRTKVSLFGKELPNDVSGIMHTSKLVVECNKSISNWREVERDF